MILTKTKNLANSLKQFKEFHFDLENQVKSNQLTSQEESDFLDTLLPDAKAAYYQQLELLGDLCRDFSVEERKKVFAEFSRSGFHNFLKGAPYFYHSIFKPRGYAGDAEMMALIYRNQYEGKTLFEQLIHRMGTECAAGIAIRNRRELMLNEFKDLKKGKILSLAAGPAQEIYDAMEAGYTQLEFTALDHDIETLKNAQNKIQSTKLRYAIANAFHLIKGKRKVLFPRKPFLPFCDPKQDVRGIKKLLLPIKYEIKDLKPASYDLIYSIGLFDYIQTYPDPNKGTTKLTSVLFDLLKPGGKLLIGNVSPAMPRGIVWAMNCLCDWYLIHRKEQEVIDFANGIPQRQIGNLEVVTEPSGVNYFLKIEKK